MFEGDFKIVHHLAPPAIAKRNAKGELVKQPFGQWVRKVFPLLARMKGLRGTALDLFGKTEERRTKRTLYSGPIDSSRYQESDEDDMGPLRTMTSDSRRRFYGN
jgi:hypothetical protein